MEQQIKNILYSVLQLDSARQPFGDNTPLLGAIPEFDSMAVVTVITSLEELFDFTVEDDEIDASVFETFGALKNFVATKLKAV